MKLINHTLLLLSAIRNAYLIEKRGVTTYTLRLQKSGNRVFVTFNPEGRILNVK